MDIENIYDLLGMHPEDTKPSIKEKPHLLPVYIFLKLLRIYDGTPNIENVNGYTLVYLEAKKTKQVASFWICLWTDHKACFELVLRRVKPIIDVLRYTGSTESGNLIYLRVEERGLVLRLVKDEIVGAYNLLGQHHFMDEERFINDLMIVRLYDQIASELC